MYAEITWTNIHHILLFYNLSFETPISFVREPKEKLLFCDFYLVLWGDMHGMNIVCPLHSCLYSTRKH